MLTLINDALLKILIINVLHIKNKESIVDSRERKLFHDSNIHEIEFSVFIFDVMSVLIATNDHL